MYYGDVFDDIENTKAHEVAKAKKREQMRFELIKAALAGLCANPNPCIPTYEAVAYTAVLAADTVLATLDKGASK